MLSALAVAEPSSAAQLLQECLAKLSSHVQLLAGSQLSGSPSPSRSFTRTLSQALTDNNAMTVRLQQDSILGCAAGAAALLSASTRQAVAHVHAAENMSW